MAGKFPEDKPESGSKAGSKQDRSTNINTDELKQKSFELYQQLLPRYPQKTPEQIAAMAYRYAKDFLEANAKIESGELNPYPIHPKPKTVRVPIMHALDEGKGFAIKKHPATGEDLMEDAPVDFYAFAPNLPADHSINQRFESPEGIKVEKLIDEHKKSVAFAGRN